MPIAALCHSAANGWEEVHDLDKVSELRDQGGNLLWGEADVRNLTREDIDTIAEEFRLSPYAVEDAEHTRQRPKLESYDNHLFVVFHQLDREDGELEAVQLACFIGDDYVLTLHAGAQRTIDQAKEKWRRREIPREHPSVLLHALADAVVDEYQEIVDELEVEIEELEDLVLATSGSVRERNEEQTSLRRRLYSVRQRVARLRRYVVPGGNMLARTLEQDTSGFSDETKIMFRDVHDHLLRIADQVRSIDELSQAQIDFLRAEQGEELNLVNRKLSAWAAIFAVATVVAGIYGMNFRLVPADGSLFGFWFAVGLITVLSAGLYLYFKGRRWL